MDESFELTNQFLKNIEKRKSGKVSEGNQLGNGLLEEMLPDKFLSWNEFTAQADRRFKWLNGRIQDPDCPEELKETYRNVRRTGRSRMRHLRKLVQLDQLSATIPEAGQNIKKILEGNTGKKIKNVGIKEFESGLENIQDQLREAQIIFNRRMDERQIGDKDEVRNLCLSVYLNQLAENPKLVRDENPVKAVLSLGLEYGRAKIGSFRMLDKALGKYNNGDIGGYKIEKHEVNPGRIETRKKPRRLGLGLSLVVTGLLIWGGAKAESKKSSLELSGSGTGNNIYLDTGEYLVQQKEISGRLGKLEAAVAVLESGKMEVGFNREIERQFGIDGNQVQEFVNITQQEGLKAQDVLTVLDMGQKFGVSGDLWVSQTSKDLNGTKRDDLGSLIRSISNNAKLNGGFKSMLMKYIGNQNLFGEISVLKPELAGKLGINLRSPEVVLDLAPMEANLSQGLMWTSDKMVIINTSNGFRSFGFFEGLNSEDQKNGLYVLNRVKTILDSSDSGLSQVDKSDFGQFLGRTHELFLGSGISESLFFGNLEKGKVGLEGKFLTQMADLAIDRGIPSEKVWNWVASSAKGNADAFVMLEGVMGEGGRTVFESTRSDSRIRRSLEKILHVEATLNSGTGINKQQLVDSLGMMSANVFLQPSEDLAVSDMQKKIRESLSETSNDQIPFNAVMTGESQLGIYANQQFGREQLAFINADNEIVGRYSSVLRIPVGELSADTVRILNGLEGPFHTSGKEFLAQLGIKNLKAVMVSNLPRTGASDIAMQTVGMIAGSPTQIFQPIISENKSDLPKNVFNTDKYSPEYLMMLIGAVAKEEIPSSMKDLLVRNEILIDEGKNYEVEQSNINELCAKLEEFLLSRILLKSQGQKEILTTYSNIVPMGSTKEGIGMFGLEATAQYLYGKSLNDLSMGETAAIVGMIQAPGVYAPTRWVEVTQEEAISGKVVLEPEVIDKPWHMKADADPQVVSEKIEGEILSTMQRDDGFFALVDSSIYTKNRALTVTRILEENKVVSKKEADLMRKEIAELKFSVQIPTRLLNTIPEAGFAFETQRTMLGPLAIGRLPNENVYAKLPDTRDMRLENTMLERNSELMDSQLRPYLTAAATPELLTRTTGKDAEFLRWYWQRLFSLDLQYGNIKNYVGKLESELTLKGIDINEPRVRAGLNIIRNTDNEHVWQCLEGEILADAILNQVMGTENEYRIRGITPNGAKDLVRELYYSNEDKITKAGYEMIRWENRSVTDLKPGDIVISFNEMDNEHAAMNFFGKPYSKLTKAEKRILAGWEGGHALMIVDSGIDAEGEPYAIKGDVNYWGNAGKVGLEIVKKENLDQAMSPVMARNMFILRRESSVNSPINQEIIPDNQRLDIENQVMRFVASGMGSVVIPTFEQQYKNSEGDFEVVNNPGLGIVAYSPEGKLEAVFDKTNVILDSHISPGATIKIFEYAFIRDQMERAGMDPDKYEIEASPGFWSLDPKEKIFVGNPLKGMNTVFWHNKVTLDQALALNFDVPFQVMFRDLGKTNPNIWKDYQKYLRQFGIRIENLDGSKMMAPNARAATGQDIFVDDVQVLGRALSMAFNPEQFFGDPSMIEDLNKAREAMFDPEIRIQPTKLGLVFEDQKGADDLIRLNSKGELELNTTTANGKISLLVVPDELGRSRVLISILQGQEIKGNIAVGTNLRPVSSVTEEVWGKMTGIPFLKKLVEILGVQ